MKTIIATAFLFASIASAQFTPPSGGGGGGAVSSVFTRTGGVVAVSGDYTAAQVTNAVDTTQTYSNPGWLTALAAAKITGLNACATLTAGVSSTYVRGDCSVQTLNAAAVANAVDTTSTYSNPSWLLSLANAKITGLAASATTDTTNAANIGSGTLPAARLPAPAASTLGGVQSKDCSSGGQFLQKINTDGTETCAAASGTITFGQGAIASLPSCTTILNEIYYPTDSYYPMATCLTGASTWTYLLEGKQFVPPVACASWTIVNGGSGSASCSNTRGAITLSTTSQVDGIEVALKAVKSAPYTETIAIRAQAYLAFSAASFAQISCGPIWSTTAATSSANTFAGIFIAASSGDAPAQLAVATENNTNFAYAGNSFIGKFGLNSLTGPGTVWYQFVDDNTNRTINISTDGINYVAAYGPTARTSPFTPGFVGFGCMPVHSTAGIPWSVTLLSDN